MEANQPRLTDEEFQSAIHQLDLLVRQFETLPIPEVQERVFTMLQLIDALHREGLARLMRFLPKNEQAGWLERAAKDPAVSTLLTLYDLLPGDPVLQAERALDSIRPYLHSHGGEVEVLAADDGLVHLRLSGSCQGCVGSAITLQRGVEQALADGFPGFKGIQVHEQQTEYGQAQPGGLITFDEVHPSPSPTSPSQEGSPTLNAPLFKTVARLDDLPPGTILPIALENKNFLLVNVDGECFAIGAECPGTDFPLTFGKLVDFSLTCPWHHEVFDVRSGKCLQAAGRTEAPRLPVYPLAIVGAEVRLAVNVAPRPPIPEARA